MTAQLSPCDDWIDEPITKKMHIDEIQAPVCNLVSSGTDGSGGSDRGSIPRYRRASAAAALCKYSLE